MVQISVFYTHLFLDPYNSLKIYEIWDQSSKITHLAFCFCSFLLLFTICIQQCLFLAFTFALVYFQNIPILSFCIFQHTCVNITVVEAIVTLAPTVIWEEVDFTAKIKKKGDKISFFKGIFWYIYRSWDASTSYITNFGYLALLSQNLVMQGVEACLR